jgi:hypothetical protein
MSTQSLEARPRLGGRRFLVVVALAAAVLLVAGGFAFAQSVSKDEPPVVGVGSTTQEKIGALVLMIETTRSEFTSEEAANAIRENAISGMQAEIATLCGTLSADEAAAVEACAAG